MIAAGRLTAATHLADVAHVAAERFGTPLYLTDLASLEGAAAAVERAFPVPWIWQYSLKANSLSEIVGILAARGWGANVVSAGEWRRTRRAGVPNSRTSFEGIGKSDAELQQIADAAWAGEPLRWVVIESEDEARVLVRLSEQLELGRRGRPVIDVLIRLNPGVAPETHAALAVGAADSKFGLDATAARELVAGPLLRHDGIALRGVHVHVGSQLAGLTAWAEGARAALRMLTWLRRDHGMNADLVNFGGGFPAGIEGAPAPSAFRAALDDVLGSEEYERPSRLAIEPGRCVVADAVTIVSRVLHVRWRGERQHIVIDAGMTELIRPALYGSHHPIRAVARHDDGECIETRVDGPICESADTFGLHRLPPLRRGDLVLIGQAGAYAASLGSHYNGRTRPAEVFLDRSGRLGLVADRWDVT